MSLDFDPLEFYKQELASDKLYSKINTIHRLRLICTILSPSQVENELLPLIVNSLPSFEDEVLFALSHQLAFLHIYLKDSPLPLLPLLETLASSEESLVRDQAIISLKEVSSYLSDYQLIHSFISLLFKLSSSKNFQSRITACKLISTAYPRSGGFKDKLRNKLLEFCQDESFLIRKSAVEELTNLVDLLDKSQVSNEIFHVVQKFLQDEQEEIRLLVIEFVKKFCILLSKEEFKAMVFPLMLNLQEDPAWKVRSVFAKHFGSIVEKCDKDYLEGGFLQILLKLLHDNENEVRVAILKSIGKVVEKLGFEKISNIFPVICGIMKDETVTPRIKIAGLFCLRDFWTVSDSEFCQKQIFPIFESISLDSTRELKSECLKNFSVFSSLGPQFIQEKVSPILRLSFNDTRNWRLRKKVLKLISFYTIRLGQEVFIQSLSTIFLDYLKDPVAEIREVGTREFKKFFSVMDLEWFSSYLGPKLNDMFLNSSWYLHKISVLKLLALIPGDFLGIFNLAAKDSLANVKVAVCKAIRIMAIEKKDLALYYAIVNDLKKDKDREVAYQAGLIEIEG